MINTPAIHLEWSHLQSKPLMNGIEVSQRDNHAEHIIYQGLENQIQIMEKSTFVYNMFYSKMSFEEIYLWLLAVKKKLCLSSISRVLFLMVVLFKKGQNYFILCQVTTFYVACKEEFDSVCTIGV